MNDLPEPNRAEAIPPKDVRLHWVETVEANAAIKFTVWSPAIWQIWAHFSGKTKPCFKNHDMCEGGHDESTLRWYGFLFGFHQTRNSPAFMQITPGAAREIEAAVAPGSSYRGMVITVHRGRSKQGPLHVKIDRYQTFGEDRLGRDLDPHHSVFRLWKVKHLGQALKFSLVTDPQDVPIDDQSAPCLKTDEPALSIKERGGVSSRKSESRKTKGKLKRA
jgi:hypothetical protein